jgi:hypothetical protein
LRCAVFKFIAGISVWKNKFEYWPLYQYTMNCDYNECKKALAAANAYNSARSGQPNLYGGLVPMAFRCFDGVLMLDENTYRNACIDRQCDDEFMHTIEPKIDGYDYPGACVECIRFVYGAGASQMMVCGNASGNVCGDLGDTSDLTYKDINNLAMHLSVISWCNALLKPSCAFENYVTNVKNLVLLYVDAVCALIDDTSFTVNRLKKLNAIGLDKSFSVPTPEYIVDSKNIPPGYIRNDGGNCVLGDGYVPYSYRKMVSETNLMHLYVWELYRRVLYHECPNLLSVRGFGPECALIIKSLLRPDQLVCGALNICDVFLNGIICLRDSSVVVGAE